jgi:multidrug efflux system membrane fusion protein
VISPQQIDAQEALVQQSEADIKADRGQIANIKLQLTYCRITAPVSGRIGLRKVDEGNVVHANDPTGVAVITQLQPIAVTFPIPQDEIARVQRVHSPNSPLRVEAYDRNFTNKLATGKLLALDNQVDSLTGTVRLKAEFANEDQLLFPNQFVNVRLFAETKRNVVAVPTPAVQRGPEWTFVYVVKDDSTVELRKVALGPTVGNSTAIESGLDEGEVVVTDGIDKLTPGTQVTLRQPDSGKDGR